MPLPITIQSTSSSFVVVLRREEDILWTLRIEVEEEGGAKDSAELQRDKRAVTTIDRGAMVNCYLTAYASYKQMMR